MKRAKIKYLGIQPNEYARRYEKREILGAEIQIGPYVTTIVLYEDKRNGARTLIQDKETIERVANHMIEYVPELIHSALNNYGSLMTKQESLAYVRIVCREFK